MTSEPKQLKPLPTDQEWNTCPVCHYKYFETGEWQFDNLSVSQRVTCENCGSWWDEVYAASHRTNLERNDTQLDNFIPNASRLGEPHRVGCLCVTCVAEDWRKANL